MFCVIRLSIALAAGLGAVAAQAQQAPIQPSDKWVAEYAESMCVLSRSYGSGKDAITLALRQLPLSDVAELYLIQSNTGSTKPRHGMVTIAMPDIAMKIESSYRSDYRPGPDVRVTTFDLPSPGLDSLEQAKSISLQYDRAPPITLALIGTPAALKVLKSCEADLLKIWGIDPNFRSTIVEYAEPTALDGSPAHWITDADYPKEAIRTGQQGTSSIVWKINIQGRVEDCRVVQSSGHALLDRAACSAITRRGRYKVALDRNGNPVVNYSARRVRWIMPQ